MALYRKQILQLEDTIFLLPAGLETDLIYNQGFEIPGNATHLLLQDPKGRNAIASNYRQFLALARKKNMGIILHASTWKAHMHWAEEQGATEEELRQANHDSVAFIARLRREFLT